MLDRRRKNPSILIPMLYFSMEVFMIFLLFTFFEDTANIIAWSIIGICLFVVWNIYNIKKLVTILMRQRVKNY